MILKICRNKTTKNNTQGTPIIEIYSGENFVSRDGFVGIGNNTSIPIGSYDLKDDITNEFVHYEVLYAYLMNNEGKTIERLI